VIKYIKKSKSSVSKSDDNEDIKITVESIISDIRENGDQALRTYSTKFDKWNPKTFLLTRDEVKVIKISD
jgi:sulfopropanediol 3-dehydrogenase